MNKATFTSIRPLAVGLCVGAHHHAAGKPDRAGTRSVFRRTRRHTSTTEWWKAFHDPQVDRLAALGAVRQSHLAGAPWPVSAPPRRSCPVARADDLPQVTLDGQEQRAVVQQGLHHSAAFRRHLSLVWPGCRQSDLEPGFLGQAGRDHRRVPRTSAQAAALDASAARLALAGALAQTYINLMLAYQDIDIAAADGGRARGDSQTHPGPLQRRAGECQRGGAGQGAAGIGAGGREAHRSAARYWTFMPSRR